MLAVAAQKSASSPTVMRPGTPADWDYVGATWRRHYRRRCAAARRVPERLYEVEQRALIGLILSRAQVVCAVAATEPDLIVGYIVLEQPAVHWIHVKAGFRGFGLARRLAAEATGALYYTHDVEHAAALWQRLGLVLSFNPYRAWSVG